MKDPTLHPSWASWPLSEKLVQLAAYHCDVLKVREEPKGSNGGPWVDRYLKAAGIDFPAPWCASFITYLLKECGYSKSPTHPAAVAGWARWAEATHRITTRPRRGDLFFLLHANGTGHMGIVLEARTDATLRTIEGNTNDDGAREGYSVCRRVRPERGLRFIRLI
jgi:hypothetical protein